MPKTESSVAGSITEDDLAEEVDGVALETLHQVAEESLSPTLLLKHGT